MLAARNILNIEASFSQKAMNQEGIDNLLALLPVLRTAELLNYVLAGEMLFGFLTMFWTLGKDLRRDLCGGKPSSEVEVE